MNGVAGLALWARSSPRRAAGGSRLPLLLVGRGRAPSRAERPRLPLDGAEHRRRSCRPPVRSAEEGTYPWYDAVADAVKPIWPDRVEEDTVPLAEPLARTPGARRRRAT